MRHIVDLNCDVGESFGAYTIGQDEAVLPYISSVNIACGFHAGDPMVMEKTVALAMQAGLGLGAHPGYPDRMGFGRRNLQISRSELRTYLLYQIGALYAFAQATGQTLQHVKLHGALYNTVCVDETMASVAAQAIVDIDPHLIVLALAGSPLIRISREMGLTAAEEVFADRAYQVNGSLLSRSLPGAVIHDPQLAVQRVVRMVQEGLVTSIEGTDIPIQADSICVHGDNPHALQLVQDIRSGLQAAGITIAPLRQFL